MEYRWITVPDGGIARGEAVECDTYDLANGQIVAMGSVPVYSINPPTPGAMALIAHAGGAWVVYMESY